MSMSPISSRGLAVSLSVLLLQPIGAVAGTITFFDSTDTVTVDLSSDIIARGSTSSCAGEVCTVILQHPVPNFGSTGWGNQTILERDGTVSDTITVVPTLLLDGLIDFFTVTFTSDVDGGPPLLPNSLSNITEDGTLQRAANAGIEWQNTAISDTILFQSDPEPATLALLSLGLAGLAWGRRKQ